MKTRKAKEKVEMVKEVKSSPDGGNVGMLLDINVKLNIDDLKEHFWRLEMKLAEGSGLPRTRIDRHTFSRVCYMCGQSGHTMKECAESKFFLSQGICRLDINNQMIMQDGSPLPRSEGGRGSA